MDVPVVGPPDVNVPVVSSPDVGTSTGVVTPATPDDVALGIDDGNNGHGNDADHEDPGNPGHSSHGKGPSTSRDVDSAPDDATRRRK
jgi:hypothetical protein